MQNEIKHIIKACQQRDKDAQKALYSLFVDRLYFTVKRYINDTFFIENILQDVFLKVFTKIDSYDETKAGISTWIHTIAIRESLNYLRKKQVVFTELDERASGLYAEVDGILLDFEMEDLLELIARIPTKYQVVFNLYEIDGYDHKEIAEMLSMTASTSRSYLTRAKKMIQAEISTMTKEAKKA